MQIKTSLLTLVSFTAGILSAAQITGHVFDSSNAVVPNAQVKVTNLANGNTLSALSANDGAYNIGPLPDGNYSVEVLASGMPRPQEKVPSRIRVGGNVQAAKIIYKVNPSYPPKAKEERRQGTVLLQAVILKDGTIGTLNLLPGAEPDLAEASMEAVKQWRYSPTLLNGEPVEVATEIQVNFTLTQ